MKKLSYIQLPVFPWLLSSILLVLAGSMGCSEEPTAPPTDPCGGRCFPGVEECNEETGLCEPIGSGDVETDLFEDTGQTDVTDTPVDEDQGSDVTVDPVDQAEDVPDVRDAEQGEDVPDVSDGSGEDLEVGDTDMTDLDLPSDTSFDIETVDVEVDYVDLRNEPPPAVSALKVEIDLPEAVNITWTYPAAVADGFVITQNTGFELEEVAILAFSTGGGSMRLPGLVPGQTYQIGVIAFTQDGDVRIDSPLAHRTILVPTPENLVLTPSTTVLGSEPESDEGVGQSEALVATLTYAAHPPAPLYRAGAAVEANVALTFRSDNDNLVTVDSHGVITAAQPGTATVTAVYDGAPEPLEAEVFVEVVDSEAPTGTLIVNLSSVDYSPEVLVLIDGPPSQLVEIDDNMPLEVALPPGRYEVEVSGSDFIEVRFVVYVRSGQETILDRYLVREESCETIGESGGTVEAAAGSLYFPPFAIREDTEVCLTTLPSTGSPWRGPTRYSPLMLSQSLVISPRMELFHSATLTVELADGLASYLNTELGTTQLQSYVIDLADWQPGPRATLVMGAAPSASMSLDHIGGIISFEGCSQNEPLEGACRVTYDSCSAPETHSVLSTAPACGLMADNFELLDLYNTISGSDTHPLIPVVSRTQSVMETRPVYAICRARPCSPEGSCDCEAVADSLGCGVGFSGEVQQLRRDVGDLQWELVTSWDLFVPNKTVCEQRFDACDGGAATCPEDETADCDAVCPWAPPL